MTTESLEKRQDPRVPLDTTVAYSQDGIVWREGRSVNITATGLLFQTDAQVPAGERLHLVFRLPNPSPQDPIEAKGRVVRPALRRGEIIGLVVEFFQLRSKHSSAIRGFIQRFNRQAR